MALFGLADVAQACPFLDVNQTRPWGIANNVAPPSPTDTFCTVMAAPPWLR